ncbi:HlyD family type I secretion periplasmic adaptor subunit [Pseudorhodoferax sp.]|uniref:HlyD family type I secretion periplasmic adaptor subunit n=1 Tax=Pseudorhodoferax sp. TaxID=1993553 RepID=UPI002DD67981|nr:HlyD family type I secretion periplasmic adaptor subunit [Pseudorhodoferax sp.]
MSWFSFLKRNRDATAVEYLPDADEIERSPVPPLARKTLHVLVLAVVAFVAWASLSQVDQVVVAKGRLVNPLPNVVVQPLETGVVQSVEVRVGQIVRKGDALASLDATFTQADESQLRVRLASLETQVRRLQQELSGKPGGRAAAGDADGQLQATLLAERQANYQAQQRKLAETAAKLRAALATNQQDQQLVASRLKSLRDIEAMQERMVAQKFGSPLQLLEAQQRTKEVTRELELAVSREQELRRELAAFDAEQTAFEKGWRQKTMEDLLTASRERDGLREQLQKAERRQRLVTLVAPQDAVVLEIAKLSPGSVVREAETFFTLVPLNVRLEAEVQVEASDVGYIRRGDKAHVKLATFPFQRHGTLDSQVRTISEDAFQRDPNARSGTDAYYLARLALQDTVLKNMSDSARLLPGMTLDAEIVVGRRSVMSYLAWPLTKGLDEAIREPR